MRLLLVLSGFCLFGLNFVHAQKFGYIDSDFILSKMPEYQKAQEEINQLSQTWQTEVTEMQKKIEELYSAYNAEQVLLTEEMKQDRLTEIAKKETELKDYQKRFSDLADCFF